MRKIEKLALTMLNRSELAQRQMNYLKGGAACTCSCYYANNGGSSSTSNRNANYDLPSGLGYSSEGCNQYFKGGGYELHCTDCDEYN